MKKYDTTTIEDVINSNFYFVRKLDSERFNDLTPSAKWLYLLFVNKALSPKERHFDSNGDIYFYFTIEEIQQKLQVSKPVAVKYKKELVYHGLLEEVRQGLGQPNKLYVALFNVKLSNVIE